MNTKTINGHEVAFYVDEPHRTVGAVIKNCARDVDIELFSDHGISITVVSSGPDIKTPDAILLPNIMKAKAKCSPEDEFDVEIGKKIAYKRLRKKYWLKYCRRMDEVMYRLSRTARLFMLRSNQLRRDAEAIHPLSVIECVNSDD